MQRWFIFFKMSENFKEVFIFSGSFRLPSYHHYLVSNGFYNSYLILGSMSEAHCSNQWKDDVI